VFVFRIKGAIQVLISKKKQVVYGTGEGEAPGDRIRERSHQSDDINHGMGGKCVTNIHLITKPS
jgi:hypothetical protein